MSATNRSETGYVRHPDDDYATPYWVTRAILPHMRPKRGIVLDPCCGAGAILDTFDKNEWTTRGIELDEERAVTAGGGRHIVTRADTLAATSWPRADVICTNPPYSLALPIIERALTYSQHTKMGGSIDVAFLLRVNFLGSQDRAEFHKKNPADIYVLSKRPSFVMSVSCEKKRDGCKWGVMIPILPTGELSRPKPTACEKCGSKVRCSSSDATEYAWFVWGPGRGNRWFILDAEVS